MARQRQILVTVTYNDLGCIIDTKAEPYEEPNLQPTCNNLATDAISRQAAIDMLESAQYSVDFCKEHGIDRSINMEMVRIRLNSLPPAQPTLYGYNIEQLELIARVLQKENLPPERIVEALTDIGRIVAIVRDEYEEALRRAVDQCVT